MSISDYQDTLNYARSKLGYVLLCYGCYILPSNLNLKIGSVNNYNNVIHQATDDMKIGSNKSLNDSSNNRINDSSKKIAPTTTTYTTATMQATTLAATIEPITTTTTTKPTTEDIPKQATHEKKKIMMLSIGLILILYFIKNSNIICPK